MNKIYDRFGLRPSCDLEDLRELLLGFYIDLQPDGFTCILRPWKAYVSCCLDLHGVMTDCMT